MNIAEIFYSIQSEGKYTGVPSIFIRTSGCNLRCDFCDSKYASWKPERNKMEIPQIIDEISKCPLSCNNVVITGGEPYLQADLPDLIKKLREMGYIITIETNGIRYYEIRHLKEKDLISWSPKLANSYPKDKIYRKLHQEAISNNKYNLVMSTLSDLQVKFVVSNEQDLTEIDNFIEEHAIPSRYIWLMPEAKTRKEMKKKQKWIVEACKRRGCNYCHRLHIEIWGDKRGV